MVIPKGATANGRIVRLEKYDTYSILGIEFSEIEAPGIRARMKGSLGATVGSCSGRAVRRGPRTPRLPGEGIIPDECHATPSRQGLYHVLENLNKVIHLSNETGDLFEQSFGFAQKQVRKLVEKHPLFYPLYTQNGKWKHEGPAWTHWCDGFLPGMMWIFQKHAPADSPDAKYLAGAGHPLHQAARRAQARPRRARSGLSVSVDVLSLVPAVARTPRIAKC